MILRKLTPQDTDAFTLLQSLGWESKWPQNIDEQPPMFEDNAKPLNGISDSAKWGVFQEDGTLSTGFSLIIHQLRYDGKWYPSYDIGGVTTRPDYRNRGSVRFLLEQSFEAMHRHGIPFSCLYPFNVPYYRKFGYEAVCQVCNINVPVRTLSGFRCDITRFRELDGDKYLEEINAFYEKQIADTNMALKRDKKLWSIPLSFSPRTTQTFTYLYRDGAGKVAGYLTFRPQYEPTGRRMDLFAFNYRDYEALSQMLGFLYTFAAHYATVTFRELPLFLDIFPALKEYDGVEYSRKMFKMIRIGDAEAVLRGKRYPKEAGSFTVHISDTLAWNNGTFAVQFGGGICKVSRRDDLQPDLVCDIRTFTRLVMGDTALSDPAMRLVTGWELRGNKETLERVFTARPITHTDFY